MPRAGTIGNPTPYEIFGTFAGFSLWPDGANQVKIRQKSFDAVMNI